jgi:hypothetical protein
VLYTVWCLSKPYAHNNNYKKQLVKKRKKKAKEKTKQKKNTTAKIGTKVRARGFNAWLLARSQFASGTNAELVPKFHVALHASPCTKELRHCTANYRPVLSSER